MASIHILGICGTFMGGIAAIAREAGHTVTGCDTNVYPPMSDQLQALGIELIQGFGADQLSLRPDVWVVGNVVSRGNPLMEAILDAGLPYTSGPQWLAEQVLHRRHVLAVAGTHGKTTTTAMLAHILEHAGLEPGYLVGGVPANGRHSARLGSPAARAPFVIEADEYDTAFFDKRSKFVHYRPRTAILNNLEFDHADIFDDLAQIQRQFHHLVRTIPGQGLIVRPADSPSLDQVMAQGVWSAQITLGEGGRWRLRTLDRHAFELLVDGQVVGQGSLQMPGAHNRMNALAAMAAASHLGVATSASLAALEAFAGVRRRMEVRGRQRGVTVIDDFAHHPTAIRLSLRGLRENLGDTGRILAVFEPRSNTMRRGELKDELPASLGDADAVFCFSAGLTWDAATLLGGLPMPVTVTDKLDQLVAAVLAQARSGDHVLVMSNGGFGGIHQRLLDALAAAAPSA